MNLENGDVPDNGSPTHIHSGIQRAALIMTAYSALDHAASDSRNAAAEANTALPQIIAKDAPRQIAEGKRITEQEWRDMLAAVRPLPHSRGTILLMLFRHCIGETSLFVPIEALRATKKERIKSVQGIEALIAEINDKLRNRTKTPFLLYRTPAYGPKIAGYVLERRPVASSKRDRGRRTRAEIEADRKSAEKISADPEMPVAEAIAIETSAESSAPLSIDPQHSDLSKDHWSALGHLLDQHAEDWNWHPLLNHIYEAKPNPVPLVELDAIAKGCGNSYQYAWGTAIVQVNKWLQKKALPYRIMRRPSERIAGFKKSHNIYAGNVTLYLLPQS